MLDIDESQLNKRELEKEIRDLWIQYKYKNRKIRHGTIVSFKNDESCGFIKTEDGDEIFFHEKEFEGTDIFIGQVVSFYTEENMKSIKAVNVRGDNNAL